MKHQSVKKIAWLVIALPALFVILAALIVAAVHGEAVAEKAPTGAEVLERFVEASGGRAAYDVLQNRKAVARLEIPSQGMTFDLTIWLARPNSLYSVIENPALGRIEKGVSGGVVWEKSIMTGPVIKEGAERDAAILDATFEKIVYWKESYKKAQLDGETTVGGEDCWKVVLTPASSEPITLYFSKESILLLKADSVADTEMGKVPVEAFLRDYRELDGVMLAHKTVVKLLGQERIFTTESIEHNVELPDGIFGLPDDVKALQK